MPDAGVLFLFLLAVIIISWYVIWPLWLGIKWLLFGRDPRVVTALRHRYELPKNREGRSLSPAETGTLVDERADNVDIVASILDLARRGYLTIHEFEKGKFRLTKLAHSHTQDQLLDLEKQLLNGLFSKEDTINLYTAKVGASVREVKNTIYTSLISEGFFPHRPDYIRSFYLGVSLIAGFTFNLPLLLSSAIFGANMPRKTLFGAQQGAMAKALRNELKHLPESKDQEQFEKYLPYAVALGTAESWTKNYKLHGLKKPTWYESHTDELSLMSLRTSFLSA